MILVDDSVSAQGAVASKEEARVARQEFVSEGQRQRRSTSAKAAVGSKFDEPQLSPF